MAPPRVLPDTNVCFPISRLDLLLRLDAAMLHKIIWTDERLAAELELAFGGRGYSTLQRSDLRTAGRMSVSRPLTLFLPRGAAPRFRRGG